jgi:hypothetical protein
MKGFSRNLARIQVKSYWKILKWPHNNKKEKEGQWKYMIISVGVNQKTAEQESGFTKPGAGKCVKV